MQTMEGMPERRSAFIACQVVDGAVEFGGDDLTALRDAKCEGFDLMLVSADGKQLFISVVLDPEADTFKVLVR